MQPMDEHIRIYTRTGDQGETGLLRGGRVRKSHPRVEAYGTVDELNSVLGAARVEVFLGVEPGPDRDRMTGAIDTAQDRLMRLAAGLAGAQDFSLGPADVSEVERAIDSVLDVLPPSHRFLVPGTSRAEAALHVARAVCRRAERRVEALESGEGGTCGGGTYLNRLSDLLFALARACLAAQGLEPREWGGGR
jgi:cob(I)alamin adenosyltransferase